MTTTNTTMLISLNFNFGKSGGKDKEITERICTETGADDADLYAYKRTVCKEAYAPIKSLQGEWKTRLRRFAPPFDIPSTFLCKAQAVAKAIALRDEYEPQLVLLKAGHLIERIDFWRELTKSKTKGAFKDEEFPTVAELQESVTWSMGIMPLSDGDAMRRISQLGGDEIMEVIVKSQNDRVQAGVKAGMAEGFGKLMIPITHMVESLKKPDFVIKESLIENVRKVIAEVPFMNLIDDEGLAQFAAQTEAALNSIDIEELRKNPVIRQEQADAMAGVLATFGAVGLRRFSL